MTHGEDYGEGFFKVLKEGGTLVVEANLTHLMLRGKAVGPGPLCTDRNWAAVRMSWDEGRRRFVPEHTRCVKPPPDVKATRSDHAPLAT